MAADRLQIKKDHPHRSEAAGFLFRRRESAPTRERAHRGAELEGVGEAAEGELTRQIPWLRVFVEGVAIVGRVEN